MKQNKRIIKLYAVFSVFGGCSFNKMPRALETGHMLPVCERVKPREERLLLSTCQGVVVKSMLVGITR